MTNKPRKLRKNEKGKKREREERERERRERERGFVVLSYHYAT